MMRSWIAIALLAGSWLFGLDYFHPANLWAWSALVAAALVLLGTTADLPFAVLPPRWLPATMAMLFLAAWCAPWPYRAAPLLIALGLALQLRPTRQRWTDCLVRGSIATGTVMFVQALTLDAYAYHTAWSHELPALLTHLLAGVAALLGIDATADGSSIVMQTIRQTHRLGATWELLLDPATLLFFIGSVVLLLLRMREGKDDECGAAAEPVGSATRVPDASSIAPSVLAPRFSPWSLFIRQLRSLTIILVAWLPLRAGLLMAIYVHRVLRSDPDRALYAMNHCFSPWMLLALLVVPVLLAWRFLPASENVQAEDEEPVCIHDASSILYHSPLVPSILFALAAFLFTAAIYWDPVGARREGRVMVVERHSTWEPTTKPYDTTSFGEPSGYNYAAIYDYLGQYFEMSRLSETDKIDDGTLAKCDVLVIKTPTARYSPEEVKAVLQFVKQGGGLLLVGDHTNYERMSTTMNDITRPMGFTFRDDLLLGFGESPYNQQWLPPVAPHPIMQQIPTFDFAVSCSIDPGSSRGRAVIASTGLWSMGPDYHMDNFHPIPAHCPEMRYGAFVQLWATSFGQGRAVAFTDSTIFSNFCVFQPGKAELFLGMVEWLNHTAPAVNPRLWLLLLGLLPLGFGVRMVRQPRRVWIVLLAAGACGWGVACITVAAAQRWAMPLPERVRPQPCVVIDRTLSDSPLSEGPDTQGDGDGYGLLEQWISRLGCHTVRKEGDDIFSGDALVVICPNRSVSQEFRDKLAHYVYQGGRLLVIDSPENAGSTANGLLWPFGLSVHRDRAWKGQLSTTPQLPVVDVANANEVVGGRSIAKLDKLSVGATTRYGDGTVMALGFGSLWSDKRMGEHWMVDPDDATKARYRVLFPILELFLSGKPLPTASEEPPKKPAAELPMKESGPAEL